jgi:uncharacterized protein
MFDEILKSSEIYLNNVNTTYVRDYISKIDWDSRLIGLKGAKGVGKTTLVCQYIKSTFGKNNAQALYVSMDSIALRGMSIVQIAEKHMLNGGRLLVIDEIHKYPNWHQEIKNIYDTMRELKVIFTGSSILQIHSASGDLSRRAIFYTMPGLSLREFIMFETKLALPPITLKDLLKNHNKIAADINEKIKIVPLYNKYMRYGYYPFYLEGTKTYTQRIDQMINNVLEVDLLYSYSESMQNIFKLKKMLHMLAISVPFTPNISQLASAIEINRNKATEFIYYLNEAQLISVLVSQGNGYSSLSKPEKVFINNANLQYALAEENADVGALREAFFVNQLREGHTVHNAKVGGDFLINGKYLFEVGGPNKKFKQIAGKENSYLVIDDWMTGVPNKVPLWMFGLLY